MLSLRALLFNLYFFGATTVLALPTPLVRWFAPGLVLPYARLWARLMLAGARHICGISFQVTGREHLPATGPALLASQHQSAFDTLVWMTLLPRTSYVMKHELTRIPLFGPMLMAAGMLSVRRSAGGAALRTLLNRTEAARAAGRQIVIFPEGTRVPPGVRVPLQPGIAAIAARLELPVLPVATNSGQCWGRRAFLKYPGVIRIDIGSPVPAGTGRAELLEAISAHWRAREAAWGGDGVVDKSVGKARTVVTAEPELNMTER